MPEMSSNFFSNTQHLTVELNFGLCETNHNASFNLGEWIQEKSTIQKIPLLKKKNAIIISPPEISKNNTQSIHYLFVKAAELHNSMSKAQVSSIFIESPVAWELPPLCSP